jgi:ankyrin repeat protein
MPRTLPEHPSLEHLKKQARELLQAARRGEAPATDRFRAASVRAAPPRVKLSDAQHVLAREYGFTSWPALTAHLSSLAQTGDPVVALSAAVRDDDTARVAKLLQAYSALKARLDEPLPGVPFGGTALLVAVRSGNREMIDLLLSSGADINARSHWWAGGFGVLDDDHGLAPFLMERGAVVDAHAAARLGMLARLEALIAADPAVVHARGGDGQTPLHLAATIAVAQCLLDHGADINARDVDHESTPAQYLVRERTVVARYLVERGATTDILLAAALGDLDRVRRHLEADPGCIRTSVSSTWFPMRDPRAGGTIYIWTLGAHRTAHQIAREFGHPEIVRFLLERSPDQLRLAVACEAGDESQVRALLQQRPGLAEDLTDDDRRRLPIAAEMNNAATVRLMLAAGWPTGARGAHGGTALHWAAWHGSADMVRELLRYQPALDDVDHTYQQAPLGWALHGSVHSWHREHGDHAGVVRALLQAGAAVPPQAGEREMSGPVRTELERWRDGSPATDR